MVYNFNLFFLLGASLLDVFLDQELKGRFLIKGKCLNKLEDYFSDQTTTAEEESVTEEEDARDDEEMDQPENNKVYTGCVQYNICCFCWSYHFYLYFSGFRSQKY